MYSCLFVYSYMYLVLYLLSYLLFYLCICLSTHGIHTYIYICYIWFLDILIKARSSIFPCSLRQQSVACLRIMPVLDVWDWKLVAADRRGPDSLHDQRKCPVALSAGVKVGWLQDVTNRHTEEIVGIQHQ